MTARCPVRLALGGLVCAALARPAAAQVLPPPTLPSFGTARDLAAMDGEEGLRAAWADEDLRAARAWLQAAVVSDPTDAVAWADLATVAASPAARRYALDQAALTAPGGSDEDRAIVAADARIAQGAPAEAAALLEQALARDDRSPRLGRRRVLALALARGRTLDAAAIDEARRLLAVNPYDPLLYAALATCEADAGERDAAADHLRRLAALRPNAPGPLLRMADVLRDAGRLAESRDAYRWALTMDPLSGRALSGLAALEERLGDATEARSLWLTFASTVATPEARFDATLHVAAIDAAIDPHRAEAELTEALGWALDYRADPFVPRIYLSLAAVDLAENDAGRAADDLDAGRAYLDRSYLGEAAKDALRGELTRFRQVAERTAPASQPLALADVLAGIAGTITR